MFSQRINLQLIDIGDSSNEDDYSYEYYDVNNQEESELNFQASSLNPNFTQKLFVKKEKPLYFSYFR